jgi:hypothetical protein
LSGSIAVSLRDGDDPAFCAGDRGGGVLWRDHDADRLEAGVYGDCPATATETMALHAPPEAAALAALPRRPRGSARRPDRPAGRTAGALPRPDRTRMSAGSVEGASRRGLAGGATAPTRRPGPLQQELQRAAALSRLFSARSPPDKRFTAWRRRLPRRTSGPPVWTPIRHQARRSGDRDREIGARPFPTAGRHRHRHGPRPRRAPQARPRDADGLV